MSRLAYSAIYNLNNTRHQIINLSASTWLYLALRATCEWYPKGMYLDRRRTIKNVLLGIIATCLILITGKMYLVNMQTAQAAYPTSTTTLKRFIEENCWVELAIQINSDGEKWRDIACY